ncbi:DNA polymerase LigD family protein [Mycobacterium intracellulare]|nr:DNA polymerase LigD family protein [Mycobacterium intracellulare]
MAAAEEIDVDGVAVRLTNPDKVYFPKLGSKGTKRHLVEYYRAVAGGPMLDTLRDRPSHLQRFPDGIDGEEIYQKRIPQHHPDYLETCQVTFPSGRTADALKVTHPAAIVWAAQMGTITLHPWQVRCPDTDHPDELRIDLDPQPGVAFEQARTVAVDVLRPLLDELGLVGYPKTSGVAGSTSSCGSPPTGISSRCAARASRWPVKWSAVRPTPSPPHGGRKNGASASSSTSTRTPGIGPWRRPIRCDARRSRRCRCR